MMITVEVLVMALVLGLAGYRAWRIVALDSITERPRMWLLGRDGRVAEWLGDMLLCPWCLGFWITGGMTFVVWQWWGLPWWLAVFMWLAASAVCGMLGSRRDA